MVRRRQESPWLRAERNRVRTAPTLGVANRLAQGENVFRVWREENATAQRTLARLSGVDYDRISLFEQGLALPHPDELAGLAKALRVMRELLMPPAAEPADGERA